MSKYKKPLIQGKKLAESIAARQQQRNYSTCIPLMHYLAYCHGITT